MIYAAVHGVFGWSWGELASFFAVMGVLVGLGRWALAGLVNEVTKPIVSSVNNLREMTERAQDEQRRTNHRLAEHDEELGKHNREIGELYGATGLTRTGRTNDRKEDYE